MNSAVMTTTVINSTVLINLLWGLLIVAATSIGGLAAAAVVLIYLPQEYFLVSSDRPRIDRSSPVTARFASFLLNCVGAVLVIIGFMMLFTPGPGILMILIGVMVMTFPGKRTLERWLVQRPGIWERINSLRGYFRKPPFQIEGPGLPPG